MTKTQIDKLGERLRGDSASDQDLEQLAVYRDSFRPAYVEVAVALRSNGVESRNGYSLSCYHSFLMLGSSTAASTRVTDIALSTSL